MPEACGTGAKKGTEDMIKLHSITGPELKAHRRAQKISQTRMGQMIGCSRDAISRREARSNPIKYFRGVTARMLEVLGIEVLKRFETNSCSRGDGVLQTEDHLQEARDRQSELEFARALAKLSQPDRPCLAETRRGHLCKLMPEPGRKRCKFHGGMSTGPKTKEGRERIAAAQRKRWAAWRRQAGNS
ncbi:helix-turn-helix transcriptional regulator [Parasedimentitalea marina]